MATAAVVAEDAVVTVDVVVTGAAGVVVTVDVAAAEVALLALVPSHNLEARRSPSIDASVPRIVFMISLCFF